MVKTSLPPGFRFHPTDVELVWYFLKRKIMGKASRFKSTIAEVELYKFAPWELPDKSLLQSNDLEWYFFCPRDRKYSHGSRTNRATDIGFWKPTGRDRSIDFNSQTVGMKKTLIFHLGKAPKGTRTDWVMYEFRLESVELANAGCAQDAYVLCKIFKKSGHGPKSGEQYGAAFKEEDWESDADVEDDGSFPSLSSAVATDLLAPVPLQLVAPEVGEPSCIQSTFEVGEPSSVMEHFGAGELSSVQAFSEPREPLYVPEPTIGDGISLEQLEAYLNSPPPYSANANAEVSDSAILHGDALHLPNLDFESTYYDDLWGLSVPQFPEPTNGIALFDITSGFDNELHPSLAEFADEHYMEISDMGFASEGNPMKLVFQNQFMFPDFTSSQGLNNNYFGSDVNAHMDNDLQLTGPSVSDDQLPPTFPKDHRLP